MQRLVGAPPGAGDDGRARGRRADVGGGRGGLVGVEDDEGEDDNRNNSAIGRTRSPGALRPRPGATVPEQVELTRLNPKYTFDTFVIGASNRFANAAALKLIGILTILVLFVTAVYGPIAAALVEFFPTRIRYTAMSLPYHIGNGWFGGLLPATSFAMVASTGDIYFGLWYPVAFALMTFVIGLLFVQETKDRDINTYEGAR